jgi:hypothetical protein
MGIRSTLQFSETYTMSDNKYRLDLFSLTEDRKSLSIHLWDTSTFYLYFQIPTLIKRHNC